MEKRWGTVGWRSGACAALMGAALAAGCAGGDEQGAGDAGPDAGETDTLQADAETNPPPAGTDDSGGFGPTPGAAAERDAGLVQGGEAVEGAPAADAFRTYLIPAGTRIRVAMDESVSTDLYRPGDAVVATVAATVTDGAGSELIPRGARLLGRIQAAAGSQGVGEAPVLEIYFETLSALNAEWPVEGAVVSAPVTLNTQAEMTRRFSPGRARGTDVVPGEIRAGAIVVVELRAPVRVSTMVVAPDSLLPDTVPLPDTLPGGGSTAPA